MSSPVLFWLLAMSFFSIGFIAALIVISHHVRASHARMIAALRGNAPAGLPQ